MRGRTRNYSGGMSTNRSRELSRSDVPNAMAMADGGKGRVGAVRERCRPTRSKGIQLLDLASQESAWKEARAKHG